MKLKWTKTEANRWTAEGKSFSYAIIQDPVSRFPFRILQMRQQGGQVTVRNATISLSSAQDHAQALEDGK